MKKIMKKRSVSLLLAMMMACSIMSVDYKHLIAHDTVQ